MSKFCVLKTITDNLKTLHKRSTQITKEEVLFQTLRKGPSSGFISFIDYFLNNSLRSRECISFKSFFQSYGFYDVLPVLMAVARLFQAFAFILDGLIHLDSCWYRSNVRQDEFRLKCTSSCFIGNFKSMRLVGHQPKNTRTSQLQSSKTHQTHFYNL